MKLNHTKVYDSYWKFAYIRQQVFFDRINNNSSYSQDPIIACYKFTNAYRAADRVSQYLIRNVIYNKNYDDKNTFFRILLFKIFK